VTTVPRVYHAPLPAGRPPLVSICIPTFNRGRYIDATLRSALRQTYEPLELVIVDDASTDDTVPRVRSYADSGIRLYVNKRTLGQSANRNRALCSPEDIFGPFSR
jgi:glycosyltransferase involved in cell wall biosynthesis